MKRIFLIIFSLFFITQISFTQNDGSGSTGFSFLKLGADARSISMGEAYSSISEDATAFIYNPARLNSGVKNNVMLMHNSSAQDLTTDFIAGKFTIDKFAFGVGIFTTAVSDIEIRTQPGEPIAKFDARNLSGGISIAYQIASNLSIGTTAKFLYEKIYIDDASGLAFDMGVNYSKDNYSLSYMVANIGSVNELRNESTKLPTLTRFGGSYKFSKDVFDVTLAAEGFKVLNGGKFHIHSGAEGGYKDFLFLRAGYQSGYENKSFTTGLGFKYKGIRIDYALVPHASEFGTSNAFSLGLNF
jgi:hypothetical protein